MLPTVRAVIYTAPDRSVLSVLTSRPPRLHSCWHRACGLTLHPSDDCHRLNGPSFSRPARVEETLSRAPRRHDRRRVESDEVVGPAALLRPRARGEAALTARAAGCLEQRRPDHLGGAERRVSCKSAPTRRRAKTVDVGEQGAAYRGQRTSRAARRAKDRPAEALSGRVRPPRPGQRRRRPSVHTWR